MSDNTQSRPRPVIAFFWWRHEQAAGRIEQVNELADRRSRNRADEVVDAAAEPGTIAAAS